MKREYLIHVREPLDAGQRAALESRFPAGRRSAMPQLLFLDCGPHACRPRDIVDYARTLGLNARLVDL